MSRKLREFHAVQFMSFLPAKKGCPYGLFCVVKCHEITFRLEPACQQSWFFYFLHFHEEPLWPWPIVAISHRGFISFLEIAEMGEKYAAVKEAQTQSADRAEWAVVLCSGVQTSCLWFLESLQIQNDTNVCCFFMGTNHLGSCSVKKVWRANNAAHAYCNGIEPNFQYYQMRRILCVQRVYWRKTASGALTYVNGYTSPPLPWKVSKKVSQSINQGLQSLGKEYVVWSKKIKVVFQL